MYFKKALEPGEARQDLVGFLGWVHVRRNHLQNNPPPLPGTFYAVKPMAKQLAGDRS